MRERERDRDRDRDRETETERHRQTDRQTDRQTETQTDRQRQRGKWGDSSNNNRGSTRYTRTPLHSATQNTGLLLIGRGRTEEGRREISLSTSINSSLLQAA